MPPKGYSNITVRREVREELERLRQEIGVRDFSDLLVLLVKIYREYTSVTSKIEEILTSISSKLDILLTSNTSTATSFSSISTRDSSKSVAYDEELEEIEKILSAVPEDEALKPRQPSERTFCKRKNEIKKVENYVKFLQSSGVLIKWWEEPDRYCFTVRE